MKKIFLISGKAQHGKDTTAEFMKSSFEAGGEKVLIVHYADLLKFITKAYLGWDGNKDEKGRKLLQYVGTDVIRKQEPDLWVDFAIKMLGYFGDNYDYIIIPDTRFPNEVKKVKSFFANTSLVRVIRPGYTGNLTPEQLKHPSETALDDADYDIEIYNDGSLDGLHAKIFSIIDIIKDANKIIV